MAGYFILIVIVIFILNNLGSLFPRAITENAPFRSGMQHLTAGIIFSAVSTELIPKLLQDLHRGPLFIGFIIGVIASLAIQTIFENRKARETASRSLTHLYAIGVDLFIDGLLLGGAFILGTQVGFLIAFALALEVLFIGMVIPTFSGGGTVTLTTRFMPTLVVSLLFVLGSLIGYFFIPLISPLFTYGFIAFATASLLYLVTEELLKEAHAGKDSVWATGLFFLGYLAILLIK